MGFFRRSRDQGDDVTKPTPFVAEVLRRIGEEYGGFDGIAPLPQGAGGSGVEVCIHIGGSPAHERSEFLRGTGIIRSVRVFAEHTEVYEGETMIAHFDDLTTADVFSEREPL